MSSYTATYSCEDNKLRLYVGRVPRSDYDALRAAGFTATPKQDCDFVATWTPEREDLAREFMEDGEDIGDEDYSPTERAADRAERFEEYRDKRAEEAGASADAFASGPSAFGHQSRARAERQAARHDKRRTYAVSQWSKAEYWQARTAGVISHALYKSSAPVRRSRILTLEAEQRKHEKSREEYATRFAAWSKVAGMEGAGEAIKHEGGELLALPAGKLAYTLANYGSWGEYTHPRTGAKRSMYSHLTDAANPITPAEAAAMWLEGRAAPGTPGTNASRWSEHYENRLTYERAMLANEGGSAAEAEMIPGGWIRASTRTGSVFTDVPGGWMQVHGVNKSPATGRVTSVKVMGTVGYRDPKPGLVSVNIERLGEGAYRAPTPEELEAFQVATKERKKTEKAAKPAAPPLVNPTDADAEKLQALWNAKAKAEYDEWRKRNYGPDEYTPVTVKRMTQTEYAAKSKGSYGTCETVEVREHGERKRGGHWGADPVPVAFKIRKTYGRTNWTGCADAVIVLTDKPQKALPLDWAAIEAGAVSVAPAAKVVASPELEAITAEIAASEEAAIIERTETGTLYRAPAVR